MPRHVPREEELLLSRLGAPRAGGERHPDRTYVAICPHGDLVLALRARTDAIALSQFLLQLHDHPLACEERTLSDAARSFGMKRASPTLPQSCELAVQSCFEDLPATLCLVKHDTFADYLLSSRLFVHFRAYDNPRLQNRFFLVKAARRFATPMRFTLFVRGGDAPAFLLLNPDATSPDARTKYSTRFVAPSAWTREYLLDAFALDQMPVPARGSGRAPNGAEMNLLTATQEAVTRWLIQDPPRATVGRVTVELEEHPSSKLLNLPSNTASRMA